MFAVRFMGERAHTGPRFWSVGCVATSREDGRSRLKSFRSGVSSHGLGRGLVQSAGCAAAKLGMTRLGLLGPVTPTFPDFRPPQIRQNSKARRSVGISKNANLRAVCRFGISGPAFH